VRFVTVLCDQKDVSPPQQLQVQNAEDAFPELTDYVQISNFVTKVLIYKRFHGSACELELTNLET